MSERETSREQETPEEKRARTNANLRPFKPGQSGNPSGKPKGSTSPTVQLKKAYRKRHALVAEAVIDAVVKDRNPKAMEILFDRIDGPIAKDPILEPVHITFVGLDPGAFNSRSARPGRDLIAESPRELEPTNAEGHPIPPHPPVDS